MFSSSSFRAERGRRGRDTVSDRADDAAAAHSIFVECNFCVFCVFFCVRERESNSDKKTAFFSLFFIPWNSPFPSRTEAHGEKLIVCVQEKLQKYTRRLTHAHAHLKTTILSSEEEEREVRDRFHSRAFFSFAHTKCLSKSLSQYSLYTKIGTLLTSTFSYQKSPLRRTGDTYAERIDTHTYI